MNIPSTERGCSLSRSFALSLSLLLLAGCAGSQSAAPSSNGSDEASESQRYVRRVTPFPVQDANGTAYEHPFLGGFNIPRPQIVDVNDDGAEDLFVQEETGRLIFFENTAAPDAPADLVWRSSHYRDLNVGEWYRFVDLDSDGLVDLLAEQPYSYLRYYHNTGANAGSGEATPPSFNLVKDTLRTVEGEPLFSDRQNIPNVADVDCDGQPDLFVGRLDGTVTRYEATGPAEDGVPRFRLVTEEFQDIEIVAQVSQPGNAAPPSRPRPGRQGGGDLPGEGNGLGGGSTRHGANTMAFADVDGDDDQDLLWGDYFEPGLLLLENQGTCENLDFSNEPVPFPPNNPLHSSGYNAPTLGDLTGDQRDDLLVGVIGGAYNPDRTAAANLYFYDQTSEGTYRLRTRRFLSMLDVGAESVPALGDLDNDGDADLLVGSKVGTAPSSSGGLVLHYENTGTPTTPRYRLADTLDLKPKAYNRAPALADLTGDGNLDLVTGTWQKGLRFHENTGTGNDPQFASDGESLVELERGSRPAPAFADLDGDADLDLVVGESDGSLHAFRNTGSASAPQFEPAEDLLSDASVDRRSAPAFRDVDGDDDQDLLVGSEGAGLTFFRNEGSAQAPRFVRAESNRFASLQVPALAPPAFADVDGDGDDDLFTGAARGGLFFFEDVR